MGQIIAFFAELLTLDVGVWLTAKGCSVEQLGERTNKITTHLLKKYKKKTYMHFLIIGLNLAFILVNGISICVNYFEDKDDFLQATIDAWVLIKQDVYAIIAWGISFTVLTLVFMILTYRAVGVNPIKDDTNGNRQLTAHEIDNEYLAFSAPDSIDSGSNLFLLAGDLSFLGDIPDLVDINHQNQKKKCKNFLSDNSSSHSCCGKKCPKNITRKCIEKSAQFSQLFELKRKGISLNIICRYPDATDIAYKKRIGRLKCVFGENLQIRFLEAETLENICILGRIKVNGGISELFWHWKSPNRQGYYTVPKTKKTISSENKTLIFLLKNVLWDSAKNIDKSSIDEYVKEYKGAMAETIDEQNDE